jgi:hypothetical protein
MEQEKSEYVASKTKATHNNDEHWITDFYIQEYE